MRSITDEQSVFLKCLQSSLFEGSITIPDNTDWDRIFEISKAQCVASLIENLVPSEHKEKWLEVSYQSKAHYVQVLYEQDELVKLFI